MARDRMPSGKNEGGTDRELERILREHFESESSDLRMSKDPWEWLEGRMDEPEKPSIFARIRNSFTNFGGWQPGPVFSAAGAAAVMLVAAVIIWNVVGDGGGGFEESEHFAAAPIPEAPAFPAAAAAPTAAPAPAATMAPAPAPTMAPTPRPRVTAMPTAAPAPPAATMAPMAAPTMEPTPTRQRFIPVPTSAASMPRDVQGETATPLATPRPTATVPPIQTPTGSKPSGTTFQDYQREGFVSAAVNNVSTFGLDTDRTSYFLALNWARNGFDVDPDSVRAEEWINSFDYGYEPPAQSDSFAITSDIVKHPLDEGMHLARIAFQAPELVNDDTPVNVTLVLDASGSMSEGGRIEIAKAAAESIRRSLREQDRIAVLHFSEEVLLDSVVEHSGPNDSRVMSSIGELKPGGSTNVQAGLNEGVRLADEARRQNAEAYNYIILMSDGVANVDATDPFAILDEARDGNYSNPLRLITIGVGIANFNDYLLEQLAQHGNGWYRYLTDVDQARSTFARGNWLALSTPFADDTRAQVDWNPEVVDSWRIIGYENRVTSEESFDRERREFAEIPAGAATTVFYELELRDPAYSGSVTLGDVVLRWVTPSTLVSNSQHASIIGGANAEFGEAAPMLRFGAVTALFADRYSSLPYSDAASASVLDGLLHLQMRELGLLEAQLGHLGAYRDLAFLMDHIARNSLSSTREGEV